MTFDPVIVLNVHRLRYLSVVLSAALLGCGMSAAPPCVHPVCSNPCPAPTVAPKQEVAAVPAPPVVAVPVTNSAAPATAEQIREYVALWCAATECTADRARVTVNFRKLELVDNDTKIRFGDDVIYETRWDCESSDSDCSDSERMHLRLIRMLGAVGPFEQVLIFSQDHSGNLCSIWGFTFVGIHEDNSVVIDEMSYCHHIVPTFKAVANGLLITIPALHVLRGEGVVPGEVWTFSENKLKQISGPRR